MANEKIINSRLQLKYDSYTNWTTYNPTLLAGEVAIAKLVSDVTIPVDEAKNAPVLFKVGPGAFNDLPWASALAADVYAWAKCSHVELDGQVIKFHNNDKEHPVHTIDLSDFVTSDELATELANYYTKNEIDGLVSGKLHTVDEVKGYAAAEINRLIKASDDEDDHVIANIANLVDYVEANAGEIAQLITDVGTANTNASNAVTTANEAKEAAEDAASVAEEAKGLAEEAKEAATDAINGAAASAAAAEGFAGEAKSAKDAAVAAQGVAEGHATTATTKASEATASATAAEGFAGEAAASAVTAGEKADAAAQSAADALEIKGSVETLLGEASGAAESAAASAQEAANYVTEAQAAGDHASEKAEAAAASASAAATAQEKAEAAQAAAEASNTSATAIANDAKAKAEAAIEASNAATQVVAGLHNVATSGSAYDLEEVGTANKKVGEETQEVPCFIFYCGTASDLI